MKGRSTAEVIRLVATAWCARLAGSGACAEKCRIAECARPDLKAGAKAMLKRLIFQTLEEQKAWSRSSGGVTE